MDWTERNYQNATSTCLLNKLAHLPHSVLEKKAMSTDLTQDERIAAQLAALAKIRHGLFEFHEDSGLARVQKCIAFWNELCSAAVSAMPLHNVLHSIYFICTYTPFKDQSIDLVLQELSTLKECDAKHIQYYSKLIKEEHNPSQLQPDDMKKLDSNSLQFRYTSKHEWFQQVVQQCLLASSNQSVEDRASIITAVLQNVCTSCKSAFDPCPCRHYTF